MTAISATFGMNPAVMDYNTTILEQSQSVQNLENIPHGNMRQEASFSNEGSGFATVLSNTLVDEHAQPDNATGVSGGFDGVMANSMPDMSMSMGMEIMPGMDITFGNSMTDQTLVNTVSNTEPSNDDMLQMMMMMMMLMMQGGGSGDMSMFPMMMSALLPQFENSTQNFNNSPNPQTHTPIANPMSTVPVNSQFGTETNSVGGVSTSSVYALGTAVMPLNVSHAAIPVITSNIGDRSPARYRAVIDQFQVETAERYRPGRDGFTYCNIFVLDVVRAMGAHIPHLGAINMCNWLGTTGRQHGWREVDAATAQVHANQGRPAVTSAGSIGHVQMVVPSRTPFNPEVGVSIAQAGRINTNYAPISAIYRGNTLQTRVRYFIHD